MLSSRTTRITVWTKEVRLGTTGAFWWAAALLVWFVPGPTATLMFGAELDQLLSPLHFISLSRPLQQCCFRRSVMSSSCDPIDCSRPGSSVLESPRKEYWNGLPFPSLPCNLGHLFTMSDSMSLTQERRRWKKEGSKERRWSEGGQSIKRDRDKRKPRGSNNFQLQCSNFEE